MQLKIYTLNSLLLLLAKITLAVNSLDITTIISWHSKLSRFSSCHIPLYSTSNKPAYNLGVATNFFATGNLQYRNSAKNHSTATWHTEPDKYGRLIIYVSGIYKITVGDKKHPISRIFTAGDVLFFNDQNRIGHISEVISPGVALIYRFKNNPNFINQCL